MASRAYRRDRSGRFASAGAGTRVTFGNAGGFANSAHRSSVATMKVRRARRQKAFRLAAKAAGAAAAVGLASTLTRGNVARHLNSRMGNVNSAHVVPKVVSAAQRAAGNV